MSNSGPPLLLDTHYWIWLQLGAREQFPSRVLKVVANAALAGNLLLSIISIWEFGMLEAKGRVAAALRTWVREALDMPGLSLAALTPENCNREQSIAATLSW